MMNMKEALRVRAEYALWSGRKAVHQPRLKSLQSKYILEQDDVNRLERGLFSKWKRGYDEKIEKEKAEVETAKAEWERISALMKTADEKLPVLEMQVKAYAEFWETADTSFLTGEDKALYRWCQQAETCMRLARETNHCILQLKEAQQYAFAGPVAYEEVMLRLQGQIDRLWMNAERFLKDVAETERVDKGKHSLSFLEIKQSELARVSRQWRHLEEIGRDLKVHNTLFEMEANLNKLREQFGNVFEELAEDGEVLLKKTDGGESHFCERDEEEIPAANRKEEKETFFGDNGLFGKMDLSKERERVLFGLELLNKEFEKVITPVKKTAFGKKLFEKMENVMDAELESINYWEKLLRDWQQDLKQYRKNAGNFPCALDNYEILEKKIWQYTEEESAEMQKAYQEHLQDTAEKLEQSEEQIRTHER
ncbi:hypothetical protein [Anaerotignum sp.]